MPGHNARLAVAEEEWGVDDLDPEEFAVRVRELAAEARRILRDPAATYGEVVELARQFDELRRQRRRGSLPEREIDRWLWNAAKQVLDYRPRPCTAQVAG